MNDSTTLPLRPSLASLRKEAKQLLKAARAGDASARARVAAAGIDLGREPRLREMQQVIAREHGEPSWRALRDAVEARSHAAADHAARAQADELLELATRVSGGDDSHARRRARQILEATPELASLDLATAVVTDDLAAVRRLLAKDPDAASRRVGPRSWEPLLYLGWSRLSRGDDALAIAEELLRAGADADAHFVDPWDCVCTVITGLMGGGEQGPHLWPPHAHAEAIARLLLDEGADPNQSQGLYNTMFRRSDAWLRLFLEYGLTAEHWPTFGTEKKARMLDFLLGWAVQNGRHARVELLLDHGADPDQPDAYRNRTAHELAQLAGDTRMVELLLARGATPTPLQGQEAFTAAVVGRIRTP